MWKWLKVILGTLRSITRSHRDLALENLALRQQLATLKSRCPRPRLSDSDRLFWVVLSQLWRAGRVSCILCGRIQLSAGIGKDFVTTGAGKVVGTDARELT